MRKDNIEAHIQRQLLKSEIPEVQKDLIRKRFPSQKHIIVICHKCQKETSYKHFVRHLKTCKSSRENEDEIEMDPKLKRGRPIT